MEGGGRNFSDEDNEDFVHFLVITYGLSVMLNEPSDLRYDRIVGGAIAPPFGIGALALYVTITVM